MQRKKAEIDLDLDFNTLGEGEKEPKLKYNPLSPREYLDFLEASSRCLPDLSLAREEHMKSYPRTRFTL
jgi:hypothetical protein